MKLKPDTTIYFRKNTIHAPKVQVNDYIMVREGKRWLSGYCDAISPEAYSMYYGPKGKPEDILYFIQRHGCNRTNGTAALPQDRFGPPVPCITDGDL